MNYLAHLFLSGNSKGIRVGNFIADAVKGSNFTNYSEEIQKGIILHRAIDTFTDNHPIVRQSKQRLQPYYGKYAGIVIDIFYDYLLSQNWDKYALIERNQFIRSSYLIMLEHFHILPLRVKQFLPFMISNNWLGSYINLSGIEQVLHRMSKRTSLPEKTEYAMLSFEKDIDLFNAEFSLFFHELHEMCIKNNKI